MVHKSTSSSTFGGGVNGGPGVLSWSSSKNPHTWLSSWSMADNKKKLEEAKAERD